MSEIITQPNEKRCRLMKESHILGIENCCPHSGNPLKGSKVKITYSPDELILEVASLNAYLKSYIGGKGEVRSMEGMIQNIARDCSKTLGVNVKVKANLIINPGQRMKLTCSHFA